MLSQVLYHAVLRSLKQRKGEVFVRNETATEYVAMNK